MGSWVRGPSTQVPRVRSGGRVAVAGSGSLRAAGPHGRRGLTGKEGQSGPVVSVYGRRRGDFRGPGHAGRVGGAVFTGRAVREDFRAGRAEVSGPSESLAVFRCGQRGCDGLLSGPGLEGRSRGKLALSGRGLWSRASRDWGGVLAPLAPGSSEACGCGVFVGAGTLRSRQDVAKRFAPAGGRRFCSGRRSDSAPSGTGTKKGDRVYLPVSGPLWLG